MESNKDNESPRQPSARPGEPGPDDAQATAPDAGDHAHQSSYKPKFTPLWNNLVTFLGIFLVFMSVLALLTFGLFSLVTPGRNPYVNVVGYVILPGLLILGLIIIPFGILLKSWRLRRHDPAQRLAFRFPRIDLNDYRQRRAAKFFMGMIFILLPIVGVSGYHGYHYTDSAEFCAEACHQVMQPQAATYGHSAHARVSCAECHIGSGASWFVKSKLSGTRQVLAVLQDSFPRPIPPAISNLRPARETCERCHWPKKFFGAQLKEIVHFASDEQSTRREIDMLLKTGGGDETTGRAEGIHMHMALEGRIEYVATDNKLQNIPWVKFTDKAGNAWVYRSDGRPSSDPRPEGEVRRLDCMDCHNRPAHKFRSPQEAVDIYLEVGSMDTTLPYIKREAVAVLVRPYPDVETARVQIGAALSEFYRANYPEIWRARKASVNQAIDEVREIYELSFFPEMNVDWQTYPDNIGHMISPGCFRCHDGQHVNQRGDTISDQCDVCHTFLRPVDAGGQAQVLQEGAFLHPVELEGPHARLLCHQCHTGGPAPVADCAGCHHDQQEFRAGTLAAFAELSIPPEPMADAVECESCHDLSEPTGVEAIDAMCMDCHDDEEDRFTGMLASWKQEVDALLAEAEAQADARGRELLDQLRRVGPLHNIEATRIVVAAVTGRSTPEIQRAPSAETEP
jgi:hypothetical protein